MNKKKIIFGLSVVGVLLGATLVFAGSFSAEASKWFTNNCITGTKAPKGISAAVCDLRDRVVALEAIDPVPGPQGLKGDKGDQGEQGLQGPAGNNAQVLHLVDANGQDLGIFMNEQKTYLPQLSAFVYVVGLGADRAYVGNYRYTLWFSGTNCTGQAFGTNVIYNQEVFTVSNSSGIRYFRTRKNDVAVSRTRESRIYGPEMGCENTEQQNYPSTYAYDEISLPFTEPLASPLEIVSQ